MRILFISRAFPPVTGGIENQNAALAEWLPKHATVRTLANRGGKALLPLFTLRAFFQGLFLMRRYDVILLGDGVLAPLGFAFRFFAWKKPIAVVLHGLDLTFATKKGFLPTLYAGLNIPCLKTLSLYIAVSKETRAVAEKLGLATEKCVVINNGIDPDTLTGQYSRSDLSALLQQDLSQKLVLVRVGRYVKHKGNEWFIRNVMPLLPENIILVTAGAVVKRSTPGDADIYPACVAAVTELHLEERVILLTNLAWNDIKLLYHTADIIVSPNIEVPGTMEGFGISVIEAALCGRPVIASNLQGLKDAIIENENGVLVPPGDAQAIKQAIENLVAHEAEREALSERAKRYTREHFHWQTISREYVTVLERITQHSSSL